MEMFGKTLIWLATAGVAASIVLYLAGDRFRRPARWAFRIVTGSLFTALAALLFLILTHRFEFLYVRSYSSTDLPLYYLIATLWGGQEGTLLLWIVFVSGLGLVFLRQAGRFERFSMATVNLFILSVLIVLHKRNPFETMPGAPMEGAGLNPLLQDFWMTIHPPVMFLGFALVVFPFAAAVAGWVRGEFKAWTSLAWVWLVGAWCALGTALVMGGYWAYKVLGWGGYWAWDPVENSSLIPWIFLTGGMHSMIMFRKKNALVRSAYLFSVLPFISVLFGSFLTRSGVLGDFSVHSFLDLGINSYLVASLVFFSVIGFGVLVWRTRRVRTAAAYGSMTTVDFFVSMGVLSFLVAGVLVLLGMSTPLWTRWGGEASNVTLRYYYLATTPVALILLFSLSVFPFMKWITPSKPFIARQAAYPFAFAMFAGGVSIISGILEPLYIILLVLGAFATASNAWLLYDRFRRSRVVSGAYMAHIGLAMLVVGAAVSSAYETRERVALPMGQPVEKLGWVFTYQGKDTNARDGQTPYHILVERPGSHTAYICSPRQFELPQGKGVMRKPAVKKFWNQDLYISPLDEVGGPLEAGKIATFTPNRVVSVDGIELTFLGFQMAGHGEGESMNRVDCPVEIVGDMSIDTLVPALESTPQGLQSVPVQFGDGRYTLSVDRIDAGAGTVDLRLVDHQNPNASVPIFWVEVSLKPMINLFWLGTTIMVLGGLLVLRQRARMMDDVTEPGAVVRMGVTDSGHDPVVSLTDANAPPL